jgi:hypothetical protein
MKLLTFALLAFSVVTHANNPGTHYSLSGGAAVARSIDVGALYYNPANLAKYKDESTSSGSSSYIYFNEKDGEGNFNGTISNSNHVAQVFNLENYNIGFMLYGQTNSIKSISKYKKDKTTAGYDSLNTEVYDSRETTTVYVLSLAKKNSNYGFGLRVSDTNISTYQKEARHEFLDGVNDILINNSIETKITAKLFTYDFLFAHNWEIKDNLRMALTVKSPTFKFYDSANYEFTFNSFLGNNYTENDFGHQTSNVKATIDTFKQGASAKLGVAYFRERWNVEGNITVNEGLRITGFRPEETPTYYYYDADDSIYTEIENPLIADPAQNTAVATIDLNIGFEYIMSQDKSLVFGAGYIPTPEKNNIGVDIFEGSFAYIKTYKNFKGIYGLTFEKSIDAGNNFEEYTIENDEIKEKIKLSKEQVSFVFGGTYTF